MMALMVVIVNTQRPPWMVSHHAVYSRRNAPCALLALPDALQEAKHLAHGVHEPFNVFVRDDVTARTAVIVWCRDQKHGHVDGQLRRDRGQNSKRGVCFTALDLADVAVGAIDLCPELLQAEFSSLAQLPDIPANAQLDRALDVVHDGGNYSGKAGWPPHH